MKPWYKEGLCFECTGCGDCCTGSPGYIWVTEEEMTAIAEQIGVDMKTFKQEYAYEEGGRWSLKEKGEEFDCIFFENRRCTVYENRPRQCRTYPFWPRNLKSKRAWEEEKMYCEGIGRGSVIAFPSIQKQLKENDE